MKTGSLSLALLLLASPAPARQENAQAGPAKESAGFSKEQLEQLVAPIALYPDSLLAHVLMASTYPLEIVEAARWVQKNPVLEGEKLEAALKDQTWDPSVKSLCGFADVLDRMSDNLDWTQDLGDAFLGQQAAVMDAVQVMRRKAFESGNLKSSKELKVTEQADKIIVIEAADPEVIYVPTYYPTAVYGSWSYPYWYYPPLYPPPPAGGVWFGFTAGVFWGAAIWGDCDWGHTEIDIDVDHHHEFVDRTENADRRQEVKDKSATREGGWNHDPSHRKGVGYKDNRVAQKYGAGPGQTRVSHDQARGYGDRTTTGQRPAGDRASAGARDRSAPSSRAQPTGRTSSSGTSRPTGQKSSSFSGSRSPSFDRASSSRGASSRGSAGARGGGRRGRR